MFSDKYEEIDNIVGWNEDIISYETVTDIAK